MVAESPAAVPALPVIAGVAPLVKPAVGEVMLTVGAWVSTVKVTVLLGPVLPAASDWEAWMVYCPSARVLASMVQLPPLAEVLRVWTGEPVAVSPAEVLT